MTQDQIKQFVKFMKEVDYNNWKETYAVVYVHGEPVIIDYGYNDDILKRGRYSTRAWDGSRFEMARGEIGIDMDDANRQIYRGIRRIKR